MRNYGPSDVIMDNAQLIHKNATKEEWIEFSEKLMQIIDRTHDMLIILKKNNDFQRLGDHMWSKIFNIEDLSLKELQEKYEREQDDEYFKNELESLKDEFL